MENRSADVQFWVAKITKSAKLTTLFTGMNDDQVRQELFKRGYTAEIVDKYLDCRKSSLQAQ